MWSKEEAKALRQQFWTALGQYMAPIPSAEGERINWINYKTGNKAVRLRLREEKGMIQTAFFVEAGDAALQQQVWQLFQSHRSQLESVEPSDWIWDEEQMTISTDMQDIHILQQAHWPQAISFFKQTLVAADGWWCSIKYALPDTQMNF